MSISCLLYQSKKSFRLSKNFLILGVVALWSRLSSSWRSSSFCSLVSLVGVSTTTVNRWSPRRRGLFTSGIPLSEGDDSKDLDKYSTPGTPQYERLVEEIRRRFNLTSLKFNTVDTLVEAIGLPKCKLCTHCFDGSSHF